MAPSIRYVPPQTDAMASLSTRAARRNPIRLVVEDTIVLLSNLRYLLGIVLPFRAKDSSDEFYLDFSGVRDMVLQLGLFVLEACLIVVALPVVLIMPGAFSIAAWTVCGFIVYLISRPMEGPDVLYSNMTNYTLGQAEQHKDERWLFVNGCIVGHSGLQKDIDRLALTFGRAVIGIHNKTWGLPFDLIECLIQRDFSYQTTDVRIAHSYIKATLVDPTVRKVILIGHSQGGIIVSMVIDQILTELPADCISKLEVYTFGSAASHFSNPLRSLSAADGDDVSSPLTRVHFDVPSQPKQVIPHIEHYANEDDMVPRWGVLHCTQDVLNNRYAGSVFVRQGASGHMFNQHYLEPMFPHPGKRLPKAQSKYLETPVNVDERLAVRRDSIAISNVSSMSRKSGLEFGDGEFVPDIQILSNGSDAGPVSNGDPVLTFARTDSGRLLVEEAKGKTVRELSRLWRYQGGRSPHTPSPYPSIESGSHWTNGNAKATQEIGPPHSMIPIPKPLSRYDTAVTEQLANCGEDAQEL